MQDPTKTVFISYRRVDDIAAVCVCSELEKAGYRVLIDRDFGSGEFPEAIKSSILSSGNFVVILSPGCFANCSNKKDWLRTEIEIAMSVLPDMNILPFFVNGFSFDNPADAEDLKKSGTKTVQLSKYNGVPCLPKHLDEAIALLTKYIRSFKWENRKRFEIDLTSNEDKPLLGEILSPYNAYNLAKTFLHSDRSEDAVNYATRSIELDSDNPEAFFIRAWAYQKLNEIDLAIENYKQCLRLDRHHFGALNNLGSANYQKGNYREALLDLYMAIAVDTDPGRSYFHLANVLRKLGFNEQALANYQYYLDQGEAAIYQHEEEVKQLIVETNREIQKQNRKTKTK